jgi:hypothetical protein
MNEVSYFTIRAQHHSQLAQEASDPSLKTAYEAIAAEMSAKVATADPNRKVVLIDGVAVEDTPTHTGSILEPKTATR